MKHLFIALSLLAFSSASQAQLIRNAVVEPSPPTATEIDVLWPAFPQIGGMREVYVSAATSHRFFVDPASLVVNGKQVRYALVVRSAGGAENYSVETIDCDNLQWRLDATGRDGVWAASRVSDWRPIENKPVNRIHAALAKEYFCPNGGVILDMAEGRDALQRGGHPRTGATR